MSSTLAKLGLTQRITKITIEGFGEVHVRDLTAAEWRDAMSTGGEASQAAKVAALALVSPSGETIVTEEEAAGLPMPVLAKIAEECARLAGYTVSSATES